MKFEESIEKDFSGWLWGVEQINTTDKKKKRTFPFSVLQKEITLLRRIEGEDFELKLNMILLCHIFSF